MTLAAMPKKWARLRQSTCRWSTSRRYASWTSAVGCSVCSAFSRRTVRRTVDAEVLTASTSAHDVPAPGDEYAAFGNVEARNGLQARVEIPIMLRALALPRGGRVLEVGCGRGVALPVLGARLAPDA